MFFGTDYAGRTGLMIFLFRNPSSGMYSVNGIAAIVYAYPEYEYLNSFCCLSIGHISLRSFRTMRCYLNMVPIHNRIYRKNRRIYLCSPVSGFRLV